MSKLYEALVKIGFIGRAVTDKAVKSVAKQLEAELTQPPQIRTDEDRALAAQLEQNIKGVTVDIWQTTPKRAGRGK